MPGGSPLMGSASVAQPVTSQMSDPTQGAPGGDIQAFAGKLRTVTQAAQAVAQSDPDIAPLMEQILGICRQALMQKAQTASMQTPSAMALPMAGQ